MSTVMLFDNWLNREKKIIENKKETSQKYSNICRGIKEKHTGES